MPPVLPPTPTGGGFETVLVADRGLLGARVVRTVQALGARAVTVHLDGEHGHGDESVLLGGPGSDADVVKVLEAARQAGADAVHPGSGPLAAHPGFAAAVVEAGLVWVGPPAGSLGGTPVLPATRREVQWLGGAAVDERDVVDDLIVSSGPPPPCAAPLAGAVSGVVSVVGELVVPHLTLGHIVTEEALGLDLVELQLRTAAGEDVPYEVVARAAAGVVLRGTGTVERLSWPEGVRVETACREGAAVPPDGVVAVLAVAASTTALALDALRAALAQTVVEGVALVVPDLERTRA
ncbi:MAG: biotin carboxylase N-terminal domain-containing protein [Mycobacteriales bacterium]|nr:biotin carboxylase N-terminal domain-containing protein [Mycobacteriales bacterium]